MPPPPRSVPLKTRLRYASMGLGTVFGVGRRARGFFIPYRHADAAAPLAERSYGAVEQVFDAARDSFEAVLADIDALGETLGTFDGRDPPPAPRWGQLWFPGLDGAAAYALIRRHRPARVVEVGAGHSTRFMARALADGAVRCTHTVIDPAPRAALGSLPVTWVRGVLNEGHLPLFESLEAGDVAFFDASHILMPGTDVDLIVNHIAPRLKPGVLLHVHDIFLPDPYPTAWAWRGYNEQSAIAPLITLGGFAPVFASRYALTRLQARARIPTLGAIPVPAPDRETSLWLRRQPVPPDTRDTPTPLKRPDRRTEGATRSG